MTRINKTGIGTLKIFENLLFVSCFDGCVATWEIEDLTPQKIKELEEELSQENNLGNIHKNNNKN